MASFDAIKPGITRSFFADFFAIKEIIERYICREPGFEMCRWFGARW
jgi:hypothetical protein